MDKNIGIWIDHRKATVVTLTRTEEKLTHFESKARPSPKATGGSRTHQPVGHDRFVAEDSLDRQYENHVHQFFAEVATALATPRTLFIIGPGEAKLQFGRYLGKVLHSCAITMEPADRMTDAEVIRRIREHYSEKVMEA